MLTIVKVGSTVAPLIPRRGDFEDWFRAGLGVDAADSPVVAPHLGDQLPPARDVQAVVVTGSPANVTDDAPWSVACERWLAELVARAVPVLGVCYGHQLLARGLGGRVGDNPNGREIGTQQIELSDAAAGDPLFEGLPRQLVVQTTHSQSALELPAGARHLAGNATDRNQAFAIGERAWGVQFHPEFDADIVRGYIDARSADLRGEGLDPDHLAESARDSEHGRAILQNFVRIVRECPARS